MKVIRMLRNTLAFLTAIPVGMDEHIYDDASRLMWLFPVYGALIGFICGLAGLGLRAIGLPALVMAAVTYACLLGITGFNHMDGLLDFADAVATPASRERRLQIMKDQYTGAAAITIGLATALTTIALISSLPSTIIVQALVASEASAKLGMVTSAFLGPPARSGLGELFIRKFNEGRRNMKFALAIVLCLVPSLPLGLLGFIQCIAGLATGAVVTGIARRSFGGVTGDVMGAINELSRATSLASCVVCLHWILRAW